MNTERHGADLAKVNRGELRALPGGGRSRTVYLPAAAADAVREGAAVSARVRDALEEISAINVELLAYLSGRRAT